MRPRSVAGILIVVALGAALVGCSALGSAPGGSDPGQPGPYAVGLTVRPMTRTLPNGQTRTIDVYLRYPVTKHSNVNEPTPELDYTPGVAPADGAPFPLIVFSHGYGATPMFYTSLPSYLASHGFVVASPSHRDCAEPCSASDWADSLANRPADVSMVLDTLLAQNEGDDPLFKHLVDPERVGVAGHSFGGWTTLTVLEQDPRFKAGLASSPGKGSGDLPDPQKLSQPLLLMAGVLDSRVPYGNTANYFTSIPAISPDHYLLTIQRAGHHFNDGCVDALLTTSCDASLPQPELLGIANRLATAFLLRYVAGHQVTDAQLGLQDRSDEYAMVKAPAEGATVAPTPRPLQSTVEAQSPAGTTLLQDSLNGQQSTVLPTSSTDADTYRAGYGPNGYEIALTKAPGAVAVWGTALLPGTYANTSIAVDVDVSDPAPSAYVQLACRYQNLSTQYRFAFRPANGEFWLTRWHSKFPSSTRIDFSASRSLVPSGSFSLAIHQGSASNHMELSCNGTTITGRINGQAVATVLDNTMASGGMWIAIGETPPASPGAIRPSARFRNLVVKQE
jgi:dienelactone hydrolase